MFSESAAWTIFARIKLHTHTKQCGLALFMVKVLIKIIGGLKQTRKNSNIAQRLPSPLFCCLTFYLGTKYLRAILQFYVGTQK